MIKKSKNHRIGGPAIVGPGDKQWYVDGKQFTEDEYNMLRPPSRGGLVSDDEEEVMRKRKNTTKRKFRGGKKMKSVKESNLYHFINQITQKNYSTADKYLQREIDRRIKAKISNLL